MQVSNQNKQRCDHSLPNDIMRQGKDTPQDTEILWTTPNVAFEMKSNSESVTGR